MATAVATATTASLADAITRARSSKAVEDHAQPLPQSDVFTSFAHRDVNIYKVARKRREERRKSGLSMAVHSGEPKTGTTNRVKRYLVTYSERLQVSYNARRRGDGPSSSRKVCRPCAIPVVPCSKARC